MSMMNSLRFYNDYEEYSEGDYIFREGDPGDVMYAVIEGEVEIIVNGKTIYDVRQGEVVGEMAILDNKPRSASAIAKTNCKLVVITRQRFDFLIKQTPMFVTQIMKAMADRIRLMNNEGDHRMRG